MKFKNCSLYGKLKQVDLAAVVKISIFCFIALSVILPVFSIFSRIDSASLNQVFSSPLFFKALKNSIITSTLSSVFSVAIALAAALLVERVDFKFKDCFLLLFFIPMLIPSISHAFGLVSLLGRNGFFTKIFGLKSSIYGLSGIIFGSCLYSFPVAFLMLRNVLRFENPAPYRAAMILGIPTIRQFTALTFPFIKRALISCFFAVFTMTITDYGVPLMIGGRQITLSVFMYNKAVGNFEYGQGGVIAILLLLPAIMAFIVDTFNSSDAPSLFVSEKMPQSQNKGMKILAILFCSILCVIIILPIISFVAMAFSTKYPIDRTFTTYHIVKSINRGAGKFLINSIFYAFFSASCGTLISFICAYSTSRHRTRLSRILHFLILLSIAAPGVVLGLSYVIFFSHSLIYGTFIIIGLVNTIHFLSSPYLMMFASLNKVNENLEDVGLCLGVKKIRIIIDCIIPKVRSTLIEIFSYYFINCMMTISAVSFLSPPSPKPISLMINQFESQLLMECAALVSILILIVNFAVKFISDRLSKKMEAITS